MQARLAKGHMAKEAPLWGFLEHERVYQQGGQNQLYERSTEKWAFPNKFKKEAKGKHLATDSMKQVGQRLEPFEQKTEEGYINKLFYWPC